MAFIERILELRDDGTPMRDEDKQLFLPQKMIIARLGELTRGKINAAQFKAFFSSRSQVDASGRSDDQDIDALVAKINPLNAQARAAFRQEMEDVILLGAHRRPALPGQRLAWSTPGYVTPAEIRAKLGI